jgi:hypothetical protein
MIEAMKQALEALEDFVDVIKYDNEQDDIGRRACCDVLSYNPHSESCKAKQAITAIKAALAQPEQEPVAFLSTDSLGERYLCFDKPQDDDPVQPLYAHPPQRTWVGLTEQEVWDAVRDTVGIMPSKAFRVYQAIKAKLKQKNGFAEEKNT